MRQTQPVKAAPQDLNPEFRELILSTVKTEVGRVHVCDIVFLVFR